MNIAKLRAANRSPAANSRRFAISGVAIELKDRMVLSFSQAGARASLSHRRLRKNLGRRCCSDKHERENSDDGSVEQAPVRATLQSTPIGPEAARRAGER